MRPLSRRTCKARDAVTTETPCSAAIQRTLGTRPLGQAPRRMRSSITRAMRRYLGCSTVGIVVAGRREGHAVKQMARTVYYTIWPVEQRQSSATHPNIG